MLSINLLHLHSRLSSTRRHRTNSVNECIGNSFHGIHEGRIEGKSEIARSLLALNIYIEAIYTASGLSQQEVEEIKNSSQ